MEATSEEILGELSILQLEELINIERLTTGQINFHLNRILIFKKAIIQVKQIELLPDYEIGLAYFNNKIETFKSFCIKFNNYFLDNMKLNLSKRG